MVQGDAAEKILTCPFCSAPVGDTQEIRTRFGNTFDGGICRCGAVYVYDRSGHNMGEAYVDALTFACRGDWDLAWSLIPDVDYELIEKSHNARKSKYSKRPAGRDRTPGYIFIRLKQPAKPTNEE